MVKNTRDYVMPDIIENLSSEFFHTFIQKLCFQHITVKREYVLPDIIENLSSEFFHTFNKKTVFSAYYAKSQVHGSWYKN